MKTLSAQDVNNLRKKDPNILIINVLSKEDFEQMHIPGSLNIPFEEESAFLREFQKKCPDKNRALILHCANKSCPASSEAAKVLEDAGYKNVQLFEGGIEEWEDAGFEVQTKVRSQR